MKKRKLIKLTKRTKQKIKRTVKIVALYLLAIATIVTIGIVTATITHLKPIEENRLLKQWITNRHGDDWQKRLSDWAKDISKQNIERNGKMEILLEKLKQT